MEEYKKAYLQERIVYLVIIAFGIAALLLSIPMPGSAPVFPRIASTFVLIMGILLMRQSFSNEKKEVKPEVAALNVEKIQSPAVIFLLTIGYAIGFRFLGFYVTTLIVVTLEAIFMGIRSVKVIILVDAILVVFLYWLFTLQLGVMLPNGILM